MAGTEGQNLMVFDFGDAGKAMRRELWGLQKLDFPPAAFGEQQGPPDTSETHLGL